MEGARGGEEQALVEGIRQAFEADAPCVGVACAETIRRQGNGESADAVILRYAENGVPKSRFVAARALSESSPRARMLQAKAALELLLESASTRIFGEDDMSADAIKQVFPLSSDTFASSLGDGAMDWISTHNPRAWRAIRSAALSFAEASLDMDIEDEQTVSNKAIAETLLNVCAEEEQRLAREAAVSCDIDTEGKIRRIENALAQSLGTRAQAHKGPHSMLAEYAQSLVLTFRQRQRLAMAFLQPGCREAIQAHANAERTIMSQRLANDSQHDTLQSYLASIQPLALPESYSSRRLEAFWRRLTPFSYAVADAYAYALQQADASANIDEAVRSASNRIAASLGQVESVRIAFAANALLALLLWDLPSASLAEWRCASSSHLLSSIPAVELPLYKEARICRLYARLTSMLPEEARDFAILSLSNDVAPMLVLMEVAAQHGGITMELIFRWEEALAEVSMLSEPASIAHAHDLCAMLISCLRFSDACALILSDDSEVDEALSVAQSASEMMLRIDNGTIRALTAWIAVLILESAALSPEVPQPNQWTSGTSAANVGAVLEFVAAIAFDPRGGVESSHDDLLGQDHLSATAWQAYAKLLDEHNWRLRALAEASPTLPAREAARLLSVSPGNLVVALGELSAYAAGEAAARRHQLSDRAMAALSHRRTEAEAAIALASAADLNATDLGDRVADLGADAAFDAAALHCKTPSGAALLFAIAASADDGPESASAAAFKARLGGERAGGLSPVQGLVAPAISPDGRNLSWPKLDHPGRTNSLATFYECLADHFGRRNQGSGREPKAKSTRSPVAPSGATSYVVGTLHNLARSALAKDLPISADLSAPTASLLRHAGLLPPLVAAADGGMAMCVEPKPYLAQVLKYIIALGDLTCACDSADPSEDDYLSILLTDPTELLVRVIANGGSHSDAIRAAQLLGCNADVELMAAIAPKIYPTGVEPPKTISSGLSSELKLKLLSQMSEYSPIRASLAAVCSISAVQRDTNEFEGREAPAWEFALDAARRAGANGGGGDALRRWIQERRRMIESTNGSVLDSVDLLDDWLPIQRHCHETSTGDNTSSDCSRDETVPSIESYEALASAARALRIEDESRPGGAREETLRNAVFCFAKLAEIDRVAANGEETETGRIIRLNELDIPISEVTGWVARLAEHDAKSVLMVLQKLPDQCEEWRQHRAFLDGLAPVNEGCATYSHLDLAQEEKASQTSFIHQEQGELAEQSIDKITKLILHYASSGAASCIARSYSQAASSLGPRIVAATARNAASSSDLSLDARAFLLESAMPYSEGFTADLTSCRACIEFARRLPPRWITGWPPKLLLERLPFFETLLRAGRVNAAKAMLAHHPYLMGDEADSVISRLAIASMLPSIGPNDCDVDDGSEPAPLTGDDGVDEVLKMNFVYPGAPNVLLFRKLLQCCSSTEVSARVAAHAAHQVAALRLGWSSPCCTDIFDARDVFIGVETKLAATMAVLQALDISEGWKGSNSPASNGKPNAAAFDRILRRRCDLLVSIYSTWRGELVPLHVESSPHIPDLSLLADEEGVIALSELLQAREELHGLSVFTAKTGLALVAEERAISRIDQPGESHSTREFDVASQHHLVWSLALAGASPLEAVRRMRVALCGMKDSQSADADSPDRDSRFQSLVIRAALTLLHNASSWLADAPLRQRLHAVLQSAEEPQHAAPNASLSRSGYLNCLVVPVEENEERDMQSEVQAEMFSSLASVVRELAPSKISQLYVSQSRTGEFLDEYLPLSDDKRLAFGSLDDIVCTWCAGTDAPLRSTTQSAAVRALIWKLETRCEGADGVPRMEKARARRDMAVAATSLVKHHGDWEHVLSLAIASGMVAAAGT